ncbi:uncharacterized protein LOC133197075 [Saccostrea echinata]|uniref:uncharacterized protein LOC133197075 n=1 Tax=Saccostrea echinata TaxID=191078 RepID=UPI002A7EBFDC|nr:uncharacterized protein LOC133197075 [Saccostrea echinata]
MLLITYIQGENIHLNKISTLYIPFSYTDEGVPTFSLAEGSAEQLAYDFQDQIVYIVGASKVNVIDISKVENPQILYHKVLGDFDPTDVEFCGDHVFVALDNNKDREAGRVVVFKKYNKKYNTMEAVLNITVGPLPDMLLPTSNCRTVLIALEAEAFPKNGKLVDPEGGVGLLKFQGVNITSSTYSYKRLNFHNFNDRWNDLSKSGVRFVYKEQNNTFSQDLEPEYITFSKDETKAYVCLQENNAIAVVDLETENITAVHGLGFKNWSNSKLDANDKDNEIVIRSLPVYGMYQPDAIHLVKMKDVEYIITASEGDSKDYSGYPLNMTGFSEEIRAKDITLANNSEVTRWAYQNNVENILDDTILGRLQVTTENGRLADGTFDKLYTFGGRGLTVWRADSMTKVYDSGSDVEDTHAESRPDLFNADAKTDAIIKSTMDSRSDNKGPESESLAVAHDGNKVIVFLGNERPGSISIYSFIGSMTSPSFESVFSDIPSSEESWTHAFDRKAISCIDPEDLKYIPPHQSPSGRPLLLVAGSASGTFSILEVKGINIENIRNEGSLNYSRASKLNVIDISDVHKPIILFHEILGDFDPTDVEFCGDHVFVALDNNQNREAGRVIVFKKYDKKYNTMEAVLNITVGPLPDMLLPSSHCSTVLIALEAEAFARDGKLVDPEGGVGLLKFHGQNISASYYSYKRLNFHNFNDRWSDLSKSGVRFIYKENNNTFSQDVEPEYITYSKDERKAYICLQENNAIAEIDLETENITAIHGLGFKDWRNSKLDASDKDNGIHIRPLPVMGMYQPDSIHVIDFKNAEYLIMANEGDIKDYSEYPLHKTGFSEVVQAKEIMLSNNSDVLRWAKENNVRNIMGDSILGRLQITKENGRLPDGTFDKLYTFGGRGFSIWRANTMTKVYDSGSDVEDTISQSRPDLFNADAKKIHEVVKKTMDSRSDDKGPESESIAIVHEGNRIIVFLGNERPGSISIYSFNGDMFRPHFESVFWNIPNSEVTWTEAFDEQTISCIDPEDIRKSPIHLISSSLAKGFRSEIYK